MSHKKGRPNELFKRAIRFLDRVTLVKDRTWDSICVYFGMVSTRNKTVRSPRRKNKCSNGPNGAGSKINAGSKRAVRKR